MLNWQLVCGCAALRIVDQPSRFLYLPPVLLACGTTSLLVQDDITHRNTTAYNYMPCLSEDQSEETQVDSAGPAVGHNRL